MERPRFKPDWVLVDSEPCFRDYSIPRSKERDPQGTTPPGCVLSMAIDTYGELKKPAYKGSEAPQVPVGFPQFSQIPRDIRLLVWQHSLPGPRLVDLCHNCDRAGYTTKCETPAALWVCQESRKEALRFYTLSFGTSSTESTIYFDFNIDHLY